MNNLKILIGVLSKKEVTVKVLVDRPLLAADLYKNDIVKCKIDSVSNGKLHLTTINDVNKNRFWFLSYYLFSKKNLIEFV